MPYSEDEIDRLYVAISELLIKMTALFNAFSRAIDQANSMIAELNQIAARGVSLDDAEANSELMGRITGKLAEAKQFKKLWRMYNNKVFKLRLKVWWMETYNKTETLIKRVFKVKEKTDG